MDHFYNKLIIITVIVIILGSVAAFFVYSRVKNVRDKTQQGVIQEETSTTPLQEDESEALKKGKSFSMGNCSGEGSVTLSVSPMKQEDFAFIEPYGLMIDAHVTPIDHQYFIPTVFHSPKDSYEVRAMADGKIIDIQHRASSPMGDYRLVFMHSCTFYTYYDLLTSIKPAILEEFDQNQNNNSASGLNIPVKAGEVVGWIGGQTLDFAVWDMEKPLTGFVIPEHYSSEAWKIYTADPYQYMTEKLKTLLMERNLRAAAPIAGKIDYDIDGRLIGNWFEEGTNGYQGTGKKNYWDGHLSIVPNHLDPTAYMISTGDYNGKPGQFAIKGNKPDPKGVSVESGLVKYQLTDFEYQKKNGRPWDRNSLTKDLKLVESSQFYGVILVKMIEDRQIKVEIFPNKKPSQVVNFTSKAKIYER